MLTAYLVLLAILTALMGLASLGKASDHWNVKSLLETETERLEALRNDKALGWQYWALWNDPNDVIEPSSEIYHHSKGVNR